MGKAGTRPREPRKPLGRGNGYLRALKTQHPGSREGQERERVPQRCREAWLGARYQGQGSRAVVRPALAEARAGIEQGGATRAGRKQVSKPWTASQKSRCVCVCVRALAHALTEM